MGGSTWYSPSIMDSSCVEVPYTSDMVVESVYAIDCVAKKSFMSCGCIAANSPPEDLICMCTLPEVVVKCSLVDATIPMVKGLSALKGESSKDIVSISEVTGVDVAATWYGVLGVL